MLVIFGDEVIIFSVRYSEFNRSIDTRISWKRWFKKTVIGSARQINGAEQWLRRFPDRIYLDKYCQHKLPISIPIQSRIRVHRIAVALGVYEGCKEFFGGQSLGSLIVHSDLKDNAHFQSPFNVGHVNSRKGFVHVFEDFTLDAVLRELDTITDFVAYLSKKEEFLSREKLVIVATGEEQLLSIYLTHLNSEGEHDFVLPGDDEDEVDYISLDESFWDGMVENPQYIAKKKADEISYAWDRLIEHFIKYGGIYDDSGQRHQEPSELEWGLRLMASEPRIRRRQLAHALVDLLENTPRGKRATRVVYSNDFSEKAYIFLILPQLESEQYDEYRKHRQAMLVAYCKVAKLRCINASYIIGIATENLGTKGASEDLVALDVRNWTPDLQEEARQIQQEASLLLDKNVKTTEGRTSEWPDVPDAQVPSPRKAKLNHKQRRALKSKHRRKRK